MAKHRLPVLVEQSVGQVETLRVDAATRYEMAIRDEVKRAGLGISCTPGCASCCYYPISVSIFEAIPIYRSLARHGKWTPALRKKLEESGETQLGVASEVWLLALIPCPLLTEDKRCSAYTERPLVCRTHVSVGDPHYCHPHRLGPETKVLPREGVLNQYMEEQSKVLRKHRLQLTTLPIGTALLLAERICLGQLDLNQVDHEALKEFEKHG